MQSWHHFALAYRRWRSGLTDFKQLRPTGTRIHESLQQFAQTTAKSHEMTQQFVETLNRLTSGVPMILEPRSPEIRCDLCHDPIHNLDVEKLGRTRYQSSLCVPCYGFRKQGDLEAETKAEIRGRAREEVVREVQELSAETKIKHVTAVLQAVLDWPIDEIEPFATQLYHLVNNPAPDAADLGLDKLSHQELRDKLAQIKADTTPGVFLPVMGEYSPRRI